MYIAYIYDKNNQQIAQIHEMIGVSVTQKINDVSTGEFVIFHDNEYCNSTYLKPYRRVKLAMKVGDQEKELFDGVIRGLAMNLT